MSYRELKDFVDKMCVLGYPRLISRENFRSPNFRLVAEVLNWFCHQLDSSHGIDAAAVDNETDRVKFITSAVHFLNSKLKLKLVAKRLYGADQMAVREMLHVANVLYEAVQLVRQGGAPRGGSMESSSQYAFNGHSDEVREMRQLASEITSKGASIHDVLDHETKMKGQRQMVLQRNFQLDKVEALLDNQMKKMGAQMAELHEAIDNIATVEVSLDHKIDKKNQELERLRKRLDTMKNIRPPFMDEFEKLENDLRVSYDEYVDKFRCLSYLEQQWQELDKNEQQELEERQAAARKMAERLRLEETLQALEAAVGGKWDEGQELDLSSDVSGSLENMALDPSNAPPLINRSNRRSVMARPIAEDRLLDSEEESDEEESDLLEGGGTHLNDAIGDDDSDVSIDEWRNEKHTSWQPTGSSSRPSARRQRLIKPMPAHVIEDDF